MSQLIALVVVFGVLSLAFQVIEMLGKAVPGQPSTFRRKGFRTDVQYWFLTSLVTRVGGQVAIGLTLMLIYRTNAEGIRALLTERDSWVAAQPVWMQAAGILVIGDFIAYWMHRAFHRGWLWDFHAIHHSSVALDWLSAVRLHPVNGWINRWVQATVLVLLGFVPVAVAVYVPFLTLYAILLHANVNWGFGPLGRIIASPRFHRWHHTAESAGLDKNFAGLFPVWDLLFGTWYMPEGRMPQTFGVHGAAIPEGMAGQLAWPFRKRKAGVEADMA